MTRLVGLLREFSGPIEADLDRYYGKDLRDLWRGLLTPRAVLVRIDNLPAGAAFWGAQGSDAAWPIEAQMLANVVDLLAGANWQRGGGKAHRPKPVPRPSDLKRTSGKVAREQTRARRFLANQAAREQRAAEEAGHGEQGR